MKWMKKNSRIDILDGIILIAPFILLFPVLFGGKALFWGTTILQFIPWRHLAVEILRQGQIPLWNPFSGMGAPLLANYQSALLYPLNWVMMLVDYSGGVEWSAIGQGYFIAAHLAIAGWGMRRYLRLMGLGELGQLIGALGFALGGYLISRASFQSILLCASWIPWIMYFSTLLCNHSANRKYFLSLVLVLMMLLLAGHAQTSWYTIWMGSAWWGYLIWHHTDKNARKDVQVWLKGLLPWITSVIAAVLVSCAQLLPTLEYMLHSQRASGVASEIGLTYSFWPWRILTFLMPNLFGNPAVGNYWGYGNYWEDAVYSGAMAVPLAIFALMMLIKGRRISFKNQQVDLPDGILFWWALILFSLLMALGKNIPIYNWVYDHFFLFRLFQAPTRINIVTQFGLAFLAGAGIDRWQKPTGKCLYWLRLGIAGAAAMAFTAISFHFLNTLFYPTIVQSVIVFGLKAMVFGFILLFTPQANELWYDSIPKTKIWGAFVLAFFLIDLIGEQWGLNPAIHAQIYSSLGVNQIPALVLQGRGILLPEDEYQLKFNDYFRFDTFQPKTSWDDLRFTWLANINLLDQVSVLNNFDPFVPQSYANWWKIIEDAQKKGDTAKLSNLLRVSAVQWIAKRESEGKVNIIPFSGYKRAMITTCAVGMDSEESVLEQLSQLTESAENTVYLYPKDGLEQQRCERDMNNSTAAIQIIANTPNQVQYSVSVEKNGWFVMNDINYPGWTAKVNGKPVKMVTANYLFRAVPINSGQNLITFTYRPWSFFIGLVISLITFVILFYFAFIEKHAHR